MLCLIGKSNDKGLGILTREWAEHIPCEVWCKKDQRTEIVNGFKYFDDARQIDLTGIDTVVMLETPYDSILSLSGVRKILKVNYEFLPTKLKHEPDVYLCSSSLNYDESPCPKVLIADPVNTDKILFRKRETANVFVHNAGVTLGDANGTQDFLKAIPLVKSDVKFIVRSQVPLKINDPRVDVRIGSVPNYWDMFTEGDVFVSPQRFRATSLPIQEAMASGMPVMCTDIKPFNEFVNFTFPYSKVRREMMSRMINYHEVSPQDIANKIDEIAGTDISEESVKAREYAESISWTKLAPQLKELCYN